VNFVNPGADCMRRSKTQIVFCPLLVLLLSVGFVGCGDEVHLPTPEGLAQFKNAGPSRPTLDMDRLIDARIGGGPHRVVPGEVLELTMPTILQVVTAAEPEITREMAPYMCRISDAGTITLPVVGEIAVAGKTLAEIELAIINAYHPEYTVTRPSVFAQVLEYKTIDVSVTGAVNKPGIYSLRSDQMSLVALLMQAEGIVDEGAAFIRIVHSDQTAPDNEAAEIEGLDEPAKRLPQLHEDRLTEPSAQHTNLKEIDVQLKFKPQAASGTKGGLTVTDGRRALLVEQLDIASETERRALLERLIRHEPQVSTAVVNDGLCELAELLQGGSAAPNHRSEIAAGEQRLRVRAVWHAGGYGLGESGPGARSGNTGFYEKLSTDDLEQTPVSQGRVDDQLAQESETLFKSPDLNRSPQISGQTKSARPQEPRSLVLPVKGLNIPFADVALRDGDRVIVERLGEPMITVVGLVNRAGNFPYLPDAKYNLMHALGFAGGLLYSAEPRYATVYRLAADGTTVSATFNIAGIAKSEDPTDALSVPLKPYDVIAVEHTPRTRAKVFWDRVFRIYVSTYIRPEDVFGED